MRAWRGDAEGGSDPVPATRSILSGCLAACPASLVLIAVAEIYFAYTSSAFVPEPYWLDPDLGIEIAAAIAFLAAAVALNAALALIERRGGAEEKELAKDSGLA